MYQPQLATRPYPHELHSTQTVDIQVFRQGEKLVIVNSTARSYSGFDLWVNQRYVHHVDALPAGRTIELSLWEFRDERGDVFNAGGFWRSTEPTPVRLVEAQPGPEAPLVGLITIRSEVVE
jgi:hypothetical protein